MEQVAVDTLDTRATLTAATQVLRARRAAELADLRLLAHWADLHAHRPAPPDQLVHLGGPGTPVVQEMCVAELAIARQTHPLATQQAIADTLDLQHRLPATWAVVEALAADAWVARRVARITRDLPADRAALVDTAVAAALGRQSPGRVIALAEAKTIEADPDAHAARLAAWEARRYVRLSRTDPHGLRHVIARVTAGDAAYIDAVVDRVADILTPHHPDDTPREELRGEAFGWLARPAELLTLLLQANQQTTDADDDAGDDDEPAEDQPDSEEFEPEPADDATAPEPVETPDEPEETRTEDEPTADPTPEEPAPEPVEPVETPQPRATAFPADLLHALRGMDPARLRPQAVLYVHLHQDAITGTPGHPRGVARVEGIGPHLATQLATLLGHTHLTVKPVIDLADRLDTNAYEHPEPVKERVLLTTPGVYFPHAGQVTRRVDFDHPTPYQATGPPGQTGTHNSGPLTRRLHRVKTFAGYTAVQLDPAQYLWRTPHGDYHLVDHTGTTPIPDQFGHRILTDLGLTHHARHHLGPEPTPLTA